MYQHNNASYEADSRRLSSNPFRQSPVAPHAPLSATPLGVLSNLAFEEWVNKNRAFIDPQSGDDELPLQRPSYPSLSRTGSDSNVNYGRDPPPPPAAVPKPKTPTRTKIAPPSYEEVAGGSSAKNEYPQEKAKHTSSRSSRSRPHRSHSDSEKQRDRRHRLSKKCSSKEKSLPHVAKNLDTIDKLDVSGFLGGRFHHDGPFDACTPHRNKNAKLAPVQAFPADGPNSTMKAAPPTKDERMNLAFGNYEDQNMIVGRQAREGGQPRTFDTLNNVPKLNPSVIAFDVNEKAAPVHGVRTAGLGLTTFLNGAPAPKNDEFLTQSGSSNLLRKKLVALRLRKNSAGEMRRNSDDEPRYEEENLNSLLRRVKSLKVGRK